MSERKQREFERREAEILAAALVLLDSEQWQSVTVAQIASQAGIGKGTVYKHFTSKEEIYARLIMDDAYQLLAELRHRIAQFENPVEGLRDLFRCSLVWCVEREAIMRLQSHAKQRSFRERLSEETQQQFAQIDGEFFELLAEPVERGMASGVFMARPVNPLFTGLHATFEGVLLMIRNKEYGDGCFGDENTQSEQQFIEDMVEFMVTILTGPADSCT